MFQWKRQTQCVPCKLSQNSVEWKGPLKDIWSRHHSVRVLLQQAVQTLFGQVLDIATSVWTSGKCLIWLASLLFFKYQIEISVVAAFVHYLSSSPCDIRGLLCHLFNLMLGRGGQWVFTFYPFLLKAKETHFSVSPWVLCAPAPGYPGESHMSLSCTAGLPSECCTPGVFSQVSNSRKSLFLELLLPSSVYDTAGYYFYRGVLVAHVQLVHQHPLLEQSGEKQPELISNPQEPTCLVLWDYSSWGGLCLCEAEVPISSFLQSLPSNLSSAFLSWDPSRNFIRVHSFPSSRLLDWYQI